VHRRGVLVSCSASKFLGVFPRQGFIAVDRISAEVGIGFVYIYTRFLYTVHMYHMKREILLRYEPNYKVK
jgi:hypothetical protein